MPRGRPRRGPGPGAGRPLRGALTGGVLVKTGGAGRRQGRLRDRGQGAAEQQGPAHLAGVHPGGPRDRLDHHAFQCALVQFAGQQPGQEGLLGQGGPGEQGAEQPAPLSLGPGSGGGPDRREHGVGLGQGQRPLARVRAARVRGTRSARARAARPGRGSGPGAPGRRIGPEQATERRVTHPDLPLAKLTGEERNRHRNLIRRRPAQQSGDLVDLDPAAGRQRDRI